MVNAIDEIIAYEREAKKIVEDANVKAAEIISKAEKLKEELRLSYLAEKNNEVEKYHYDVEITGKEHIHKTMDMRDEAIRHIDAVFDKNSDNWIYEIYSAIIG